MMRRALLALSLLVGACAMPAAPTGAPIEERSFDTAAWVRAVAAAETEAEQVALSNTLLDNVDWRTACGEDDPTTTGRGRVRVLPVDGETLRPEGRTLADVTCQVRPTGRVFGLVDLEPGRAPRLVRAFGITDAGVPSGEAVPGFFGTPTYAPDGARQFELLTPRDPDGGCGLFVRYQIDAVGGAAIAEVRLYDGCDAPRPVAEWPVTYTAP